MDSVEVLQFYAEARKLVTSQRQSKIVQTQMMNEMETLTGLSAQQTVVLVTVQFEPS